MSLLGIGDRALPESGAVGARVERGGVRVPGVKIADHRHAGRVGRPDAKGGARMAQLTAHHVVEPPVRTLTEQVYVLLAEGTRDLRR